MPASPQTIPVTDSEKIEFFKVPFIAGQKPQHEWKDRRLVRSESGVLLQHGREFRPADGKVYRVFQQGPIKGTQYYVGPRGELRHLYPQFKGKKKHRKRFIARLRAALKLDLPPGYTELKPEDKFQQLDMWVNVLTMTWEYNTAIGVTVEDLPKLSLFVVRGARALHPSE